MGLSDAAPGDLGRRILSDAPIVSRFRLTLHEVSVVFVKGLLRMPQGTIKKIVKDRGFGFISTGPGKGDIFFHVSAVADNAFDALEEGQSVEYEVADDGERGKGPRAGNVRPI
ncbi:MAG: cold-shock protein [Planctomycetaceae bacterium]